MPIGVYKHHAHQLFQVGRPGLRDEKNPRWKGESASYFAKHIWMVGRYGNPEKCQECGTVGKKNGRMWSIHWCNISGKFKRMLSDWKQLCVSCHRKFDYGRGSYHSRGEDYKRAILKESDVVEILKIHAEYKKWFVLYKELPKKYGVSKGTINSVVRRENWKHVKI